MDTLKNKILVALGRIPLVKSAWGHFYSAKETEGVPWTPLAKPLSQCRVALLSTGGIHLKTDKPFDMSDKRGDPSYRKIPSDATSDQLMITDIYYDYRNADADINLVLPIDALRTCQQEGLIGPTIDYFYGFLGHLEDEYLDQFISHIIKEIARQLKEQGADVAILIPA